MLDMFSEQKITINDDLFGSYIRNNFLWAVGVFAGNGAIETIKYALDARLEIFFPYRMNNKGNYIPIWKNYLFIEYINPITIEICRQNSNFISFISFNNEKQPELVYKDSIDECLKLLKLGKYNYSFLPRQSVKKGTIARIVNDNNFNGKIVKLLCDITPNMNDDKRIPVHIGNVRMMIEVRKLCI